PSSASNPGWAHELRHDGHRLQIPVRDRRGRVHNQRRRLVEKLPADVENAAEAPPFDPDAAVNEAAATALAFDLLMHNGEDVRRSHLPTAKRFAQSASATRRGIQYVEHAEGDSSLRGYG